MADPRLTQGKDSQPEVRLELTNAEGHQVWALYSDRPESAPPPASPLAQFLVELPALAWRWRRRLAIGAAVGVASGLVYLFVAAPVYVVRALVHIEQRDSVLQHYDPVRSAATFIATQSEVINSPRLLGSAFDAVGLPEERPPGFVGRTRQWLRSALLPSNGAAPPDPRAQAVLAAQAALGASPVVGTDVMSITYRTEDPGAGVAFLDALIARYRDYVRGLESDAHGEGLDLLRTQDAELARELEELQARYDAAHAQTLALGQDDGALSVQKMRLEEHARAHVEAQGRRIELENRVAQLARKPDAAPQRRALLEELRQAEASAALLAETERELRAARRTEQMLARLYENEWAAAKQLEQRRREEERIRREIERVSAERDSVLALLRDKELRVLSLDSDHAGTVVRVLAPPSLPTDKVWPRPGIVLAGFGFMGALAGLGWAVFSELRLRAFGLWR